jgi:hypothetical protein
VWLSALHALREEDSASPPQGCSLPASACPLYPQRYHRGSPCCASHPRSQVQPGLCLVGWRTALKVPLLSYLFLAFKYPSTKNNLQTQDSVNLSKEDREATALIHSGHPGCLVNRCLNSSEPWLPGGETICLHQWLLAPSSPSPPGTCTSLHPRVFATLIHSFPRSTT